MKVVSVACLLLALTVAAYAQNKFTADFQFTQTSMRGGSVSGKAYYDYANHGIRFEYTTSKLVEIYKYNDKNGRQTTSDAPYAGQWLYSNAEGCDCQTSSLTVAMPQFYAGGDYRATTDTEDINGKSCAKYSAKTTADLGGVRIDVASIYMDGNTICRVVFTNGRVFTFSNVDTSASIPSSAFTTPSGCKCGKPVDIVIVLDRSSSINYDEFLREKEFTVGFLRSFRYGSLGANVALVHFMKDAWTTLHLTEGNTEANVNSSVDKALQCCADYFDIDKKRCCCCGTSISSGVIEGTTELLTGRPGVEKMLITVTDGYHNHNRSHLPCKTSASPNESCREDLIYSVQQAYAKIPGLISFGVGVGDLESEVSMADLLVLSNNNTDRVLTYSDFDDLAQNFLDVVGLACQVDESPCGSCCGFCGCGGVCYAPDTCDQVTPCTDNALSGTCCKETPKKCVAPSNCTYSVCDSETNECKTADVTCPAASADGCITWACNEATGRCVSTLNDTIGCGGVECYTGADCDDGDACTIDSCEADKCVWTVDTCDDSDPCTIDSCNPTTGCVNAQVSATYCDDNDACTNETCVAGVGCVYENVTCYDDENGCTIEECDALHGCRSSTLVCAAPANETEREARNETLAGSDVCRIYACNASLGACGFRDQDCAVVESLSVGAVAGLTAGIIAAIVIAVVVAVVLLGGGGAFAYSKAMGGGAAAPAFNNPLYTPTGNEGVNPLHKA